MQPSNLLIYRTKFIYSIILLLKNIFGTGFLFLSVVEMEKHKTFPAIRMLEIAFDPGTSLTKVVYSFQGEPTQVMVMEPEILELPVYSFEDNSQDIFSNRDDRPEDDAWLKLKRSDEGCFVLGYLARTMNVSPQVSSAKHKKSVLKLLAVIGAIAQKRGLQDRFSVKVSCVLPYNEMAEKGLFEKALVSALRSFYFRGKHYKVKLNYFFCAPEGGGIAVKMRADSSADSFSQKTVAVLMFGHRNTSCLTFSRGKILASCTATSDLGFHRLIETVSQRSFISDSDLLIQSIYAMHTDISEDDINLRRLVRARASEGASSQAGDIARAIAIARSQYWAVIKDWICRTLPPEVDLALISGGAASSPFLREEIEKLDFVSSFSWVETVPFVKDRLRKFPAEDNLSVRFADVSCLFDAVFSASRNPVAVA